MRCRFRMKKKEEKGTREIWIKRRSRIKNTIYHAIKNVYTPIDGFVLFRIAVYLLMRDAMRAIQQSPAFFLAFTFLCNPLDLFAFPFLDPSLFNSFFFSVSGSEFSLLLFLESLLELKIKRTGYSEPGQLFTKQKKRNCQRNSPS